jgi:hypothetical protein
MKPSTEQGPTPTPEINALPGRRLGAGGFHFGALGAVLFALAGVGLLIHFAVSVFDIGTRAERVEVSNDLYVLLIAVAALLGLWGAARAPSGRTGWLLIAGGLCSWALGELIWLFPELDNAISPRGSEALFLGLYIGGLTGLRLLTAPTDRDRTLSLGMLTGLLALTTVWAAMVFGGAIDEALPERVASDFAYPLLDLAMLALVVLAWWSSGWANARAFGLLAAGVAVTAVGDTIYAVQIVQDSYRVAAPIDSLWPLGALLIGAAPWLATAHRPTTVIPADRISLVLGSLGAASALGLLLWDHYDRLSESAVILATLTLLCAGVQLALLHRQRARAVADAEAALVRSAQALALAVGLKDEWTRHHSDQVSAVASAIGAELGLPPERINRLSVAARLHDAGRAGLPEHLIEPGDEHLPDGVWAHAVDGARMLETAGLYEEAAWVRHQHERWDGEGYPDGLSGEEIPLESRIIAVADAIGNARERRQNGLAIQAIALEAGSRFDPAVVDAALHLEGLNGSTPKVVPREAPARAPAAPQATMAHRYGRTAGLLFLFGSLLAFPSSLLADPAPASTSYVLLGTGVLCGLFCLAAPWERISENWFYVLAAGSVVQITLTAEFFDPIYSIYYVIVAVYSASAFHSRESVVAYLALISAAWLTQPLYITPSSEVLYFAAVGTPVTWLIALMVVQISERLEQSRTASMELAEEAVGVTLRIRGGRPGSDQGVSRPQVRELARIHRYLRGQRAGSGKSILRR